MGWYLYIAEARTGRLYVGISQDVNARIRMHNLKRGAKFAVNQGPFKLIYCSDVFVEKSHARKREIQVKKWTRYKKLMLVRGYFK